MDHAFKLGSSGPLNKGRRTANRILDAAEELFARHGYGGTSLRDIATQAGLQQPGLYKHFAGKEDLYRQVYERALQPMTDLMEAILASPEADFGLLTDRMTDLLAAHPNIAKLLFRAAISSDSEPDTVALLWLGRVVGYGRKLSEKAGMPYPDDQLAVQVVAIFNMLFGFFWASPLLEKLSGMPSTGDGALAVQKGLLRDFIAGLAQSTAPTRSA
jgi:AcrR family transcriptional regulator